MIQGGVGAFTDFSNLSDPSYTNEFFDLAGSPIIIMGSGDTTTNFVDDGSWLGDYTNWPARYYRIRLVP